MVSSFFLRQICLNSRLTRVALPVKVLRGIAMAFQVKSCLLASWAVGEWDVVVGDFIEEVDFFLLQKKTRSNRMHRGVTPSLVEEPTIFVERVEVVDICIRSQPLQTADLKVGPLHGQISNRSDPPKKIRNLQSGTCCMFSRHHHSKSPSSCLPQCAGGWQT